MFLASLIIGELPLDPTLVIGRDVYLTLGALVRKSDAVFVGKATAFLMTGFSLLLLVFQ